VLLCEEAADSFATQCGDNLQLYLNGTITEQSDPATVALAPTIIEYKHYLEGDRHEAAHTALLARMFYALPAVSKENEIAALIRSHVARLWAKDYWNVVIQDMDEPQDHEYFTDEIFGLTDEGSRLSIFIFDRKCKHAPADPDEEQGQLNMVLDAGPQMADL
jgi:hypothetical protein